MFLSPALPACLPYAVDCSVTVVEEEQQAAPLSSNSSVAGEPVGLDNRPLSRNTMLSRIISTAQELTHAPVTPSSARSHAPQPLGSGVKPSAPPTATKRLQHVPSAALLLSATMDTARAAAARLDDADLESAQRVFSFSQSSALNSSFSSAYSGTFDLSRAPASVRPFAQRSLYRGPTVASA